MSDATGFFTTVLSGLGVLHLLVTAAAVYLFWPHQRISHGMNLVLAGLFGMLLSGIVGRLAPFVDSSWSLSNWSGIVISSVVGLMSWGLVVIGLAITFNDVRRLVSLVKDRRHDRE